MDFRIRRSISTLLVALVWIKWFYWMRLFTATSFYIRLIGETVSDIKYFLILFFFITCTFASMVLVMEQGRPENEKIIANRIGSLPIDAVVGQYLLALGEFNTYNYPMDGQDIAIWAIFLISTFFTQLTFLNMLIAIMGDTFSRVTEVKEQSALAEKIRILSDYVIVVKKTRLDDDRFLFSIAPSSIDSSSWEGTVSQLSKIIEAKL